MLWLRVGVLIKLDLGGLLIFFSHNSACLFLLQYVQLIISGFFLNVLFYFFFCFDPDLKL